jgi:hypothetical protein
MCCVRFTMSPAYRKEVEHHLKTAQHLGNLRQVKYLLTILAVIDPGSADGGAPPRGMTPVHTRSWPQVGPRSGCLSPQRAHTVCQSTHTGPASGRLPQMGTTGRQSLSVRVMIHPLAPHHAGLRGWHGQEPPLEKVLCG